MVRQKKPATAQGSAIAGLISDSGMVIPTSFSLI
jgi:hypothetical protein